MTRGGNCRAVGRSILDTGNSGAYMAVNPVCPPRDRMPAISEGHRWSYAKQAFERAYLFSARQSRKMQTALGCCPGARTRRSRWRARRGRHCESISRLPARGAGSLRPSRRRVLRARRPERPGDDGARLVLHPRGSFHPRRDPSLVGRGPRWRARRCGGRPRGWGARSSMTRMVISARIPSRNWPSRWTRRADRPKSCSCLTRAASSVTPTIAPPLLQRCWHAKRRKLPVLAWSAPQRVANTLNTEHGTSFLGWRDAKVDLVIAVDWRRQRQAIAYDASQSGDNPVLWRRLELSGASEETLEHANDRTGFDGGE